MKRLIPTLLLFLVFSTNLIFAQEAPQDSVQTLSLLFVGDVMGHGPQIKSAELLKDKVYDYDPCFKYVKPIIQSADLAVANLEVTLPGSAPYQGYPRFRSPDDLALALRMAGFDLLLTANNHSNDAGKTGVLNTINTLQAMGFYQTGTFRNQDERNLYYPLVLYRKGFKLAFLNYTYDTNKIKTEAPTLVNEIDETLIQKDLQDALSLKADAVIVFMHWGPEYQLQESRAQQQLARKMLEWGADIIVGAHPHVVQPIKEIRLDREGQKPPHLVAYSLGNFISNQYKPNTNGGLMLELNLQKNRRTGQTLVQRHRYIPVWRFRDKDDEGNLSFYAVPVSAFEKDQKNHLSLEPNEFQEMKNFAAKTRKHLNRFQASERIISLKELGLGLGLENSDQ